ncbi:putative membrane protein YadS, partial [Arthrobacter sp. UYEF21]
GAVSVDVAYAISTIFLFNIAAVLAFPFIGHLLARAMAVSFRHARGGLNH